MLYPVFTAKTIAAGESATSDIVPLSFGVCGLSLYFEVSGDGSADIFYQTSLDSTNFVLDSRAVKRGAKKTSGPDGDGKDILKFSIFPCDSLKLYIVEAGGANSVTVTVKLAVASRGSYLSHPGTLGDSPVYDGTTNAIRTIDYEHHEIHSGSHYHVQGFLEIVGADDVLDMTFTTPDTTKWIHWTWQIDVEKALAWYIYEDVTATNPLSESMTIFNSDRNSDKTSGVVLKYELQADLATANVDTDVSAGTLISFGQIGDDKRSEGGGANRGNELILKQDSIYCLRAVASAAGYINFNMEWYEHTNR